MAGPDRRITSPPGGTVTSPSGGSVIIIIGGVSYDITVTNLLASIQSQITANDSDILTLQTNVTALQDLTSKNTQLNSNGATWNLPANSCITGIVIYWISSTPVVTITSGSDTIMSAKTLNGTTIKKITVNTMYASEKASASTITITITGGRADVITFYKKNLTT